ncbi:RAQPRD family integrative conjugative element protein [Pseudomonas aeruginosa]|uniref:integrative conjugative element protein, RAQPRD family n=1 Tax=Pseudomonas aeruginosa TaxID=287 RepID=UPI0015C534A3|nr:RAQPRD family plasmid [Pseudomonas aeruginosa]
MFTTPTRLATSCLAFASLLAATSTVQAAPPTQRQDLVATQRQIEALERLVRQSSISAASMPGERYHFDYPRLLADLARVRAGIEQYLTPSRAQPREPEELGGKYSAESAPQPENKS